MGGETVPKGVNRYMLRNGGLSNGSGNGVLDGFFTQVVPSDLPASGIYGELRRGENILPDPFLCGIRIFPSQRIGQINLPKSRREIPFMESLDIIQVQPDGFPDTDGQNRCAVLVAFGGPDQEQARAKINVLDPQTKQLHETQSRPIKKLGHQQRRSFHKGKHLLHFLDGQHGGQLRPPLCPDGCCSDH